MDIFTFAVSAVVLGIVLICVINYFIKRRKKSGCGGCPMSGKCGGRCK